eukprot:TRINITY_DN11315_c0_g1_i4.p1 TRINITY_DN11315_c0_g1~~TRINITY_DN11315_c0_g1_i4.p1  ORF type:complete len:116 (+),score=6.16 TRINITY_DN11315_c0_g1_i4:362-709(+)
MNNLTIENIDFYGDDLAYVPTSDELKSKLGCMSQTRINCCSPSQFDSPYSEGNRCGLQERKPPKVKRRFGLFNIYTSEGAYLNGYFNLVNCSFMNFFMTFEEGYSSLIFPHNGKH